MAFEADDSVILHDPHSEFDGEEGTVTQVVENMFGGATYVISFDGGQEQGVPEDALEPVEEGTDEDESDSEDEDTPESETEE